MKVLRTFFVVGALAGAVGCGKYGPPIPPEALSPAAVGELAATAAVDSVTVSWTAPERDQRKKELRSIEGYRVMRRTVGAADETEVAFVEDTHLRIRDEQRAAAEAAGKSARRVKADPNLSRFSVTDRGVASGTTYLYRVVPLNQGGVEGAVRQQIRVAFRGAESTVAKVKSGDLEGALFSDALTNAFDSERTP